MERGKRSRVRAKAERDEGTGKRVEKGRRTELGKAIRTKVGQSSTSIIRTILPFPDAVDFMSERYFPSTPYQSGLPSLS